ncbi:replicative DNA helicase [Cellulomonas rhizosphaerae]|uniref:DNA 5'-3' helicase n=1 Tax=Cellulomonas rhizosphaerae TaxID=2293719 RepID=A0A413RJD4_9CELL|nr:replicative DNA helicase [Cellulomonas rhizosphaerae]RHA38705.1 replicative DNA helicase [Cellulomonas rhizosphaerae]
MTIPHDEAEKHILGSLLNRPALVSDVVEIVQPADMYAPRHEVIYRSIITMDARGLAIDPLTVGEYLTGTGELAAAGGALYLADLYATPPATSNAPYYARIVAEHATRRRLHAAGTRIVQLSASGEGDVAEIVEQSRAEVDAVSATAAATVTYVGDTIDDTLDALEQPSPATPTPWTDLNDIIGGWRPGALYVVGARPGIGKTIVGIEAAIGLAERGHVAFSSLEMPRDELMHRILAHQALVPINRMDSRTLTDDDWRKIAGVRAAIGAMTVAIDDRGAVTTTDVRAHARTVSRRGPLVAVIVDYLQLMASPRGERRPRHEVVADYSRQLKLLAKELACPVIALSQLNRASENRQDKRPSLADLRESGAVEQDADVVLLLHEHEEDDTAIDVLIAKNRHGARGSVELTRRGWFSRMDTAQWSPTRALNSQPPQGGPR